MRIALLWACLLVVQDDVEDLVRRLGSDDIEECDEAARKLVELGEKAEPALRRASKGEEALNVRARTVLATIAAKREEEACLKRVRNLPKTYGERKFTYRLNGESIGGGVLRTREKDGLLELEDSLDIEVRGKSFSLKIAQTSTPDRWLSPREIRVAGKGGELTEYTATVEKGRLTAKCGAVERVVDISDRTVTMFALLRVVSVLPASKGARFVFDSFEAEELNYKPGHELECLGEEEIELGGAKVKAWKWEQTGLGIRTQRYWVRDGVLVRALIDDRKEIVFDAP